ncbi:MAG: ABC transporter, permease protein [Candidatus Moranbacteria bacterium GW2011_GWE1_36_7]|nr:MAG: ABC transporter, permease protein [Candidatus Moranbacteria bacterium GW2011_GWD2_36_12]KKQ05998.1 MAG: ABC transporter, permease protein [Candidatus Moranbacteria bacterium GW2011_GWE2_36_40]KKQ14876.1 MAG: ABC transporter, permease protein [Candidatus Moranbacteria bacterium GW2011_GWE1_36_7]
MIADILKETFWSLSANKVRSGLTILGIVIGIASVITMVSIGQGAQKTIESSIQAIGSNLIIITPGAQKSGSVSGGQGSSQTLTVGDADMIVAEVPNVKGIAPEVSKRYQLNAKGNNTNTQVVGTVPDYLGVRNIAIDSGTFVTSQHVKSSAKVVVLGPTVRDDIFGVGADPIGQTIRIKNVDFEVIGVALAKGGTGFSNPDNSVYVPLTSAQHFLSGDTFVTSISVAANDQNSMTAVQQQISEFLLKSHNITDPAQADFTLMNQTDIIATASSITGTFTMLLSSIAGISLLVGGIGIMNMMLTTVTERTREIGLRKAVGIKKIYINMQFLAEAVALTFLGGFVGVALGWGASLLVSKFVPQLTTVVSLSSVLLAFGVSAAVGIIFGFYPARRAANLSPMEALRYE